MLEPLDEPLYCHQASVRALATGRSTCLVSGDASGELCVWQM